MLSTSYFCPYTSVNISSDGVSISPSGPISATADTYFTLNCSADITPNPLPPNVPSPYFEWFFEPDNSSLPSGVNVSPVTISGNTYISTLWFSPLRFYHAGIYKCRLGGNNKLVNITTIAVNGEIIATTCTA